MGAPGVFGSSVYVRPGSARKVSLERLDDSISPRIPCIRKLSLLEVATPPAPNPYSIISKFVLSGPAKTFIDETVRRRVRNPDVRKIENNFFIILILLYRKIECDYPK